MIVDISQTKDSVVVSYINETGNISLKQFNVDEICNGFYTYEICDENDPDKIEGLRGYSMKNEPVKTVPAKKFDKISLRDFLTNKIPEADREDIFAFRSPTFYACDIELDLSDDTAEVFPDPKKAEFPICTIQITAPNLNTVVLTKDRNRIKQGDEEIVNKKVNDWFAKCDDVDGKIRVAYIIFDTEKELLEYWWRKVKDSIHCTVWYNSWGFDMPYLETRSANLRIDPTMASPTGEYKEQKMYPKHRLTVDYYDVARQYGWDLKPIERWTLDHVSQKILGVGTVPYEGSFKEMYLGPYTDFTFYGAVDTILLQLIFKKRGYYNIMLSLAFFGRIGLYDVWATTKISEAVVFDALYEEGLINPYPYVRQDKARYDGGWVKDPARKFSEYPTCFDFSGLYPNIYQSTNISFENHVKRASSKEEAKKYAADKNYFVSVDGNIYKNDKDYTMRRVQKSLVTKRKAFQKLEFDLFQNIEPAIEAELRSRGVNVKINI